LVAKKVLMKNIHKIIFLLLSVGLVLKLTKTLFAQNNAEFIIQEEVYGWYFKAAYYGNILVSVGAFLSVVFYRKYFPKYIFVCYVLMILLVFITSFNDLEAIMKRPSIFYSVKGIGTYLNFGILFFVASDLYFPKLLKIFYMACFVFIVAGIYNLSKVGLGASRIDYLNAIKDFAVYLIWVFPFFLLKQDDDNKKSNIINIGVFGIIFIFILSTGARSYLVIYAIYLFIKFKSQLQGKSGLLFILASLLILIGSFFLFSSSGLGKALEGAINNLTERATEDSRSEQLQEFLSQYNPDYLIEGVGPLGRLNWSHWPVPYYYLDNQFLLLGWWAGLPTLLVYVYYVSKPILKKTIPPITDDIKTIKTILIFWLLACAGFAIYVGMSSDPYYDFITLLIGLAACQNTTNLADDEQ
jgi:hypothetical protein